MYIKVKLEDITFSLIQKFSTVFFDHRIYTCFNVVKALFFFALKLKFISTILQDSFLEKFHDIAESFFCKLHGKDALIIEQYNFST